MIKYLGFDLGDGESSMTYIEDDNTLEPIIISVEGAKSFISAVARQKDGNILIGENACTMQNTEALKLRFKSKYLTETSSKEYIGQFAKKVLQILQENKVITQSSQNIFMIGCPAGWNSIERERYLQIFKAAGYNNASVVSESRAAFLYVKYSSGLKVDYDMLKKPTLLIDIGSSTIDFAYIINGKEMSIGTFGEVKLGGGLLDKYILESAVEKSPYKDEIKKIFSESSSWYYRCELAARHLKEMYFSNENYWESEQCTKIVTLYYSDSPIRLKLEISKESVQELINKNIDELEEDTFYNVLKASIEKAKEVTKSEPVQMILLTGGASRMLFFQKMCQEIFKECIVITCKEPEFAIARGLAFAGRVDHNTAAFRKEIADFITTEHVEKIVNENISVLISNILDVLTEIFLKDVVIPVVHKWRNGEIERLNEIDVYVADRAVTVLKDERSSSKLYEPVSKWLNIISSRIQDYTNPICDKYDIPRKELQFTGVYNFEDAGIKIDISNVLNLSLLGVIINIIVSTIVGIICGGGGMALISTGFIGIFIGAVISVIAVAIGWKKAEILIGEADIPHVARKMLSVSMLENKIMNQRNKVAKEIMTFIYNEDNTFVTELCNNISLELEMQLKNKAEDAEMHLE